MTHGGMLGLIMPASKLINAQSRGQFVHPHRYRARADGDGGDVLYLGQSVANYRRLSGIVGHEAC